jgi:hypothetical protein
MVRHRARMWRRISCLLLLPALLGGCLFGGGDDRAPSRPIRPDSRGPVTLNIPTSRETQQCYGDLSKADVRYSALPDRDYGGGCQVIGAVQLIDIGLPVSGLKAMRCPLARNFIAWLRNGVAPAAREILDGELVRVETYGTYSCRGIVGGGAASAGKMSEHGLGNAVDVAAFILRDGRRVTVQHGWRGRDEEQQFLRAIHKSACRRFATVLSPDYNAAHYNHMHLDMGRGPFCR